MTTHLQQSLTAAQALAEVVPNAKFCGFKTYTVEGKVKKHPLSLVGNSVGKEVEDDSLVSGPQLHTVAINGAEYWGIYLQRPVQHPDGILWAIDIDYKNAQGEKDPRIDTMIKRAKEFGILREKSFSRKGAHLFVIAPDDEAIPAKIKLAEGQEIELFGHARAAGKSVLLTGVGMDGEILAFPDMRQLLNDLGIDNETINPKPKAVPNPPSTFTPRDEFADVERALSYVHTYDDYDEWLKVGMALKDKLGNAGFNTWDRWSAQSPKYDPDVMQEKWESFKGTGVSFGSIVHMARQSGMPQHTYTPPRLEVVDQPAQAGRFKFMTTKELLSSPRVGWRVLDVIPKRGLIVMWGAPGSGKSFAAFDLAAHIAMGKRYQGKRVKKGLALIIAAEGDLTARTMAYIQENNIKGDELDNLRILKYAVDMRDPHADMPDLMAAITEATKDSGQELAMIVVDTLNRVMHGGNENSSEDMGAVISNAKRIEDAFQCAVMFVHHSGKDETKGSRGHSSLKGAMDAEISILRSDDIRTFKIEKQKEGNDYYDLFNFRLKTIDLGPANIYDPDAELNERFSSCVIEPTTDQPEKKEPQTKNSGLLDQAIRLSGTGDKEDVRTHYYALHNGTDNAKRKAFWQDWKRYMAQLSINDNDEPF
jgi:ATP:corrinoid adenosyltransferase